MSGSTAMSGVGRSLRITCQSGPTSIWSRADKPPKPVNSDASIPATLHPVLEHLKRHRAIVLRRAGDRTVIAFLDPALLGPGAVACERKPHQTPRALRRQAVAVEQHLPKQGLRLVLAFLRRESEPARAIGDLVARGIARFQIKTGKIVLRV